MNSCKDIGGNEINNLILKDDGTVLGFYTLDSVSGVTGPNYTTETGIPIGKRCCEGFGYTFDSEKAKCIWRKPGNSDYIKLILNPKIDDGEIYEVRENETCGLEVEFDYLLEFDAYDIFNSLSSDEYLNLFNGLEVTATIEKVEMKEILPNIVYESPYGLNTIYSDTMLNITEFVDYISGNTQTGIRLTGSSSYIALVKNAFLVNLGDNCKAMSASTFNSCWLKHKFIVSNSEILESIANQKIKLGIEIRGIEVDFSLLIDKIVMRKTCELVERTDKRILKCPGFELERVIDNRKSWCFSGTTDLREYDLEQRETNYLAPDSRLLINTKELDLQVDPSLAIESNLLSYIENNEACILSADTTYGVDFQDLLSTELSSITSTDEFTNVLRTELIDVKNRQTIQSYPTLRLLYDKYMNPSDFGCSNSGKFNYNELIRYSKSLGIYWSDLIEQLIPATTIWGSSYVYRNNTFDENKFRYKPYTLFTCNEPTIYNTIASATTGIEVIETILSDNIGNKSDCVVTTTNNSCSSLYIVDINSSPEFRGIVMVTGTNPINNNDGSYVVVSES